MFTRVQFSEDLWTKFEKLEIIFVAVRSARNDFCYLLGRELLGGGFDNEKLWKKYRKLSSWRRLSSLKTMFKIQISLTIFQTRFATCLFMICVLSFVCFWTIFWWRIDEKEDHDSCQTVARFWSWIWDYLGKIPTWNTISRGEGFLVKATHVEKGSAQKHCKTYMKIDVLNITWIWSELQLSRCSCFALVELCMRAKMILWCFRSSEATETSVHNRSTTYLEAIRSEYAKRGQFWGTFVVDFQ